MKKLIVVALAAFPIWAHADAVTDAAHVQFEQVLSDVNGTQRTFSPRLGRLIGWTGSEMRELADAEKLNRLIDAHWDWTQQTSPENATFIGYAGQNDRWSDLSFDNLERTKTLQTAFLAALQTINAEELSSEQRLNLQLLLRDSEHTVAGHAFPDELMPVNQMFGLQMWVASTLGAQPLFTAKDRADFLARLQGLPVLLAQMKALLAKGVEEGVTPPRITLVKVPQQFLDLAPEDGRQSPLLQSFARLPTNISAEEKAAFEDKALQLYNAEIRPAVLAAYLYVRDEYLPKSVRATGLSNLANGKAWYAYKARGFTTTDMTPDEIHQIGLDEVKRIRGEIEALMTEVGFKGTIPAFVAKTKKDPRWYYTDKEAFLRDYRALGKQVDSRLPRVFRKFAALPYGVEEVPEFRAKGSAAAYYLPGSAEFGRPGVFYVNTVRMADSPRYEMEALLLHEAVPGHHFQIALAQEIQDVPDFRKNSFITAYIEGWGLYAESLGPELGLYTDPYSRFGALSFEIWRAIRLVVDTGMHSMGWSREQAIEYFFENTGRSRDRIEAEVDRYLVMPGQALAYKIGELKIRELRTRAEVALGEQFDVRAFHEVVLGSGSVPLSVLEELVDEWIAQQEIAEVDA